MNATESMKALCLAGRVILENGGETYRAEDTVRRMARSLELSDADAFAIPSGLFISFTDASGERRTSLNRVHLRGTHLSRVDRVNQISRRLADGLIDPDELYDALREAAHLDDGCPVWKMLLAAFITGMSFTVMFGGGWIDLLVGGLCAALTQLFPLMVPRDSAREDMAPTLLAAAACAFVPLMFYRLTGLGVPETMIAGAIMPLVPGLSMTNAVQDLMRGDMLSGVAHGARAVLIAALVAGGALVGTYMSGVSGLPAREAAFSVLPLPLQGLTLALSSLVAGASFGALQFAPRRAVLWGGMLGMLGYLAYWTGLTMGVPETACMFVGMLLAALGAQQAARSLKMIFTVFVTIAMMPLVPGLGLYRAMRAVAEGDMGLGASLATHAMALILMISLGIALASTLSGIRRRRAVPGAVHKGRKTL